MRKKIIATLFAFILVSGGIKAQDFNDYFIDQTLRVDYLFNGNAQQQTISLDELVSLPGWAGRRHSLDSFPLAGNGNIVMKDNQYICKDVS